MKLLSYLAFIAFLQGLTFAVIVYLLQPRAALNRIGAVVGLLNAWWNGCLVFVYGADPATALAADRLSYVAVLGLSPMVAWLYLTFAAVSPRVIASLVVPAGVIAGIVAVAYLTQGFPRSAFVPGPWGNVGIERVGSAWSLVSYVAAITLDLVYFVLLFRKRQTTTSWRLKRLIGLILIGILSAIGAYLVLGWISQAFGIPGLIFLPAAVLTLLNFYIIAQYGFLRPETAALKKAWAAALPRSVFLLDKDARVIGRNRPEGLPADLLPQGYPAEWRPPSRDLPECVVETPRGPLRLSPHYDRFGDFVGAVAVLGDTKDGTLSAREDEVLALLVGGAGNQAIADRLFISPGTVKRHVHAILAKTGARSLKELLLRYGAPR